MPTRRILEVSVLAALMLHPIMGVVRLWAAKTLYVTSAGGFSHGVAEVLAVAA